MRKLIIITIFSAFTVMNAIENMQITTEKNYTKDIYLNLSNKSIFEFDNNNWDIAFSLTPKGAAGASILINEAYVELYSAPYDTTRWNNFDNSTLDSWERLYNPKQTWKDGAFNKYRGAISGLDMGWGELMPELNYWTYGDSLYAIKLRNESWIKFKINSLKQGVWEFSYSDIDNNNEKIISLDKADYTGKNFIYFSFSDSKIIDREPLSQDWDLLFSKFMYFSDIAGKMNSTSGVLSNKDLKIATVNGEIDKKHEINNESFSESISAISNSWKTFDMSALVWSVDKEKVFIIKNKNDELFNLSFLQFGGRDNGEIEFQYKQINPSSVVEATSVSLYPNPVTDYANLIIDNNSLGKVNIKIFDTNGNLRNIESFIKTSNFDTTKLDFSNLTFGLYIIEIAYDNKIEYAKIIKK